MRHLAFAAVLGATLAAATPLLAQVLKVDIDQAARITLNRPVQDVIVGNPQIADVTVMDGRHVMVVGKSFGVTNLMITGQNGRPVFNRQVVVGAPDADHVSIYRGLVSSDYACSPRCERQAGSASPTTSPQTP
ncbi:MAG TPA: pilus assembly protein N-terminal domain-containing protein [Caulobacteraceae bacterium]|nr:pilus assembly protein N-terminal domain-containing protein [Caulobacteraceae bacterium]